VVRAVQLLCPVAEQHAPEYPHDFIDIPSKNSNRRSAGTAIAFARPKQKTDDGMECT
jgi:hypothetical protein